MAIQMWIESGTRFSLDDLRDELPNSRAVQDLKSLETENSQLHEELKRLRILRSSLLGEASVVLGQLLTWVDESDQASDYASSCALGDIVNNARRWERVYERAARILKDGYDVPGLKQAIDMTDHFEGLKPDNRS